MPRKSALILDRNRASEAIGWSIAQIRDMAPGLKAPFDPSAYLKTEEPTTVVNTETMCELLQEIARLGLTGPITLVLDNARYQRNAVVQALAQRLGITLLYLPSYPPNLNLIERLWKFIKRRALYGRYHPTFAAFQATIRKLLGGLRTTHVDSLKTLMTLNFFDSKMSHL